MKRKKIEENLQIGVCKYIKNQYPNVIFFCDPAAGMKLTIGQAVKCSKMRSSRGLPDLFIAYPKNEAGGLFLELKNEGTKIFLKDGKTVVSDEHIRRQLEVIVRLNSFGFMADFAIGFDDAKKKIDEYLNFKI